jgi:hypothetical protein
MKRPILLIVAAVAAAIVLLLSLGTWLWSVLDVQIVAPFLWLILGLLARRRFRIIGWCLLFMSILGFKVALDSHWPTWDADPPVTSTPTAQPSAQPTNMLEIPARG